MPNYPVVGTVGESVFAADFVHDGKPLLFSGAIQVYRIGTTDQAAAFYFAAWGKLWADTEYLNPNRARWFNESGQQIINRPEDSKLAKLATEKDYYGRIVPVLRLLERSLSAEATSELVEPVQVGLVPCWQFKS